MKFHELVCSSFLRLSSSQEFCSACYYQEECSVFISKLNNCTLYKNAVVGPTKNNETNAGICPKTDHTRPWKFRGTEPVYPPELPVPGKHLWCGEKAGSICTFPFSYESKLFYEPYIDSQGVSRCGTLDSSRAPTEYSSVNNLDTAVPCNGECQILQKGI